MAAPLTPDVGLWAETFVTMVVIFDPVGNVPIFLALTERAPERRPRLAGHATLVAGSVVVVFALAGQELLRLLGIGIPAIEVSGGLLMALVALELLRSEPREQQAEPEGVNPALVPLGTPLLAGPGAIAATMVYVERARSLIDAAGVIVALLLAVGIVYLSLRLAALVGRLVSRSGIELLSRIVGLLLAAIAVQIAATGIDTWVRHGVH